MMDELLPTGVVAVESWGDDRFAYIFPSERAQLGQAIESRICEFSTARSCARQALGTLGIPPVAILRGSRGEPLWPSGVVGSITHCPGYRGAAVARQQSCASIGIDAEVDAALPEEVVRAVCVEQEIAWLQRAPESIHWDRVIFSAKESVYKAWFPMTKLWLDFHQILVNIKTDAGTFHVRPLGNVPEDFVQTLKQLSGRFLVRNGIILTGVIQIPKLT